MKNILYKIIILILILTLGYVFYSKYEHKVYSELYEFYYEEDDANHAAISNFQWLEPLEINKPGYYNIVIRPDLLSLENQTHHILELIDENDNIITSIDEWLYSEVVEDRTDYPQDEPFIWMNADAYNKTYEDSIAKKLVKIEEPGIYSLKYLGYKNYNNLEDENVYFWIYKKLDPFVVGALTLILAILASIFIPKILPVEKIFDKKSKKE